MADPHIELASQLSSLAKHGVPLVEGLEALAHDTPNRKMRRIYGRLGKAVQAGKSLDAAIEQLEIRQFLPLATMLRATEDRHVQAALLSTWESQARKLRERGNELRAAIIYPLIVLALLAFIGYWMFTLATSIVQSFATEFGLRIRPPFDFLLWARANMHWAIKLGVVSALILLIVFYFGVPKNDRQRILIRFPLFGPMLRWCSVGSFFSLAALLLKSRVPLPDILKTMEKQFYHTLLRRPLRRISQAITRGEPFSQAIESESLFPREAAAFLRGGESTQNMVDSLEGLAELADERFEGHASLTKRITPAILLIIGATGILGIWGMIASMMHMLFNLTGSL